METREICRDFEFLMNPLKFLEDLIGKILRSKSDFKVWIDQHGIYIGDNDLHDNWKLIIDIYFSSSNEKIFEKWQSYATFHGKTNIGKFFLYPIWVEVFKNRIKIFQIKKSSIKEKIKRASLLSPIDFFGFFSFLNNPPKSKKDCFEYHIPEIPGERARMNEAMKILECRGDASKKGLVWTMKAGK